MELMVTEVVGSLVMVGARVLVWEPECDRVSDREREPDGERVVEIDSV